jgi:hypothetical protein
MAGPLPHTSQVQQLAESFIDEVKAETLKSLAYLKNSAEFRRVYRISLAADAVLSKLLQGDIAPPPFATRASVKAVPLLVCVRQLGPARIELRRFMELVVWSVYFQDHRVEWERFASQPTHGFSRDEKDPIEYCAHRELDYYLNYAKSRVAVEPSKLASGAVDDLRILKGKLNEAVHPGSSAQSAGHSVPLDAITANALQELAELQQAVFKCACLLVASVRRKRFDTLPPMHRAHFDWLLGRELAKKLRSGPFGLS